MDLWFPATRIPTGHGQAAILPVLVMTLTFSKFLSAMMIPSRQAGDILAGMWGLIAGVGKVSKTLVWERESAIGGRGKLTDPATMTVLPPVPPVVGLTGRVRLARDYYVRVDANDYSAHPSAIGRHVDIAASMDEVVLSCQGRPIGVHTRCWDTARTITDPAHVAAAKVLRREYARTQQARHEAARRGRLLPVDPTLVRDPSSYDSLFGTDFDPAPASASASEVSA